MGYIENLFNLHGKVAVVTGAGGLLCGAIATGFAQAGCSVVLVDSNKKKAEDQCQNLIGMQGKAVPCEADVTCKSDHESVLNFTLDRFGRVDVLVNGAGINAPTPLFEITEQEWERIFAVNVKGALFGCQVFGAKMKEIGYGSIINITSTAAEPPLSKAFAYSSSKSALRNLTENVARELAPCGVRVNSLRPGFFPTEWNRKNFITPERESQILGHTPMRRYGEPHELIGATLWLASDAAQFVTGADIRVDGGYSAMTI